jgi:hydrophobic/amphiphilic exporter-1 (mainly G- bacteria), HAE1 family
MSELFIKRPVMTTLVMIGLFLFGVVAYVGLPVSDLPNVDFPTIQVSAALPGASPDTMASSVATPLERQFTTIAGLDSMTSQNAQGVTSITLQFNLSRSLDAAAQDVQAAIAAAARQLPPNLPTPPSYQKVNPADQPILYLALTSAALPLSELDEYGETMLAQRISTISGVAQVLVYGSQKYAVRLQIDPKALATRGIGLDEVANAVSDQNVNLPTGTLYGPHTAYTVQANGQLTQAKSYRNLIVAYRNGNPVRLDQLGRVTDSVENNKTAAWYVGERSVILAIQRQPGTNTVAVAQAVKRMMPQVQQQLPASVSLHVLYDRSESIRESVTDVKFTLALTLALVILVIFLFLRNVRATVIPSLALPMSLVGTFIVLYLLGYSLDNLSLMALTLSVGFVVDDAIVMLENIVRHIEMGEGVMEASLKGSREIGFTIVSMTISLAAVFIPVLFMGGIVGRLFHEFAVAIGASILVSGFISLSLTPMLCSRFLKPHEKEQHGKLYEVSERGFDWMLRVYERGLTWSLGHRTLVLGFSLLVLIAMVPLFIAVPKGFLPSEDVNMLIAFTESQEGISFDALVKNQKQAAAIIQQDPNVQEFMSSAGSRGATGSNQGIIFMHLKPRKERDLSADEVMNELRPKLAGIPGMRVYLQNPPPIRIGGQLTKAQYQFTLQDPDTKELYRVAPQLEQKMRGLASMQDVNSDLQLKNPQVQVTIDRDKASALGVTPIAVETALYTAYGSRQISTIYAPTNEYQVIMELLPEYQSDPSALPLIYVRSSSGSLVPLSAVATLTQDLGPLTIQHAGQLPSVTISFNLRPGHSIGEAVEQVNRLALQTLPATVSTSFQGTAQAFQASLQGLGVLLVLAIAVIYLVLGILYESFIHPLTILSALPFAGFGALLTLLVFRTEMSIYAFVGIIMLVGLVKKNGIMMIDFALETQRADASKTPSEAIYEACVVRFRPIMMTTFAALMGTLPIALGFGAGAESRRPLGLAVVGGLVFSQMLTLFVTPVFYTFMEGLRERFARKEDVAAAPAM